MYKETSLSSLSLISLLRGANFTCIYWHFLCLSTYTHTQFLFLIIKDHPAYYLTYCSHHLTVYPGHLSKVSCIAIILFNNHTAIHSIDLLSFCYAFPYDKAIYIVFTFFFFLPFKQCYNRIFITLSLAICKIRFLEVGL